MSKRRKNLMRTPDHVLARLQSSQASRWVAAGVIRLKMSEIAAGLHSHLGIKSIDGTVQCEPEVLLSTNLGRYCKYNQLGRIIRHRDRPKETRYWSVEAPNFGDWSLGSHEVIFEKKCYPVSHWLPRLVTLTATHLAGEPEETDQVFRVKIDEVLDRADPHFMESVLFTLNLLQEAAGTCDIFEAAASDEEYLRVLFVNWEIFPPGEREGDVARIMQSLHTDDPEIRQIVEDRHDFFTKLGARRLVQGANGFARYMGAELADDLVLFENLRYGNAVYLLFEDWQTLSQMSRLDLLSSDKHFVRVIHSGEWKKHVERIVLEEKSKRGIA